MKRLLLFCCFLNLPFTLIAQSTTVDRPRLVVGIVVDQMRWDYLYRFYDRYERGGFKRLMKEGFNCEQAMINYIPAYTAPGHACVYTGSIPSINGISGNFWFEKLSGKNVYCVEDKSVSPIGGSKVAGMMSPENLLTTTITDELRLATNFRSKVFAFSLKDRGSILPAGHLGKAYWYDDSTGNFITSSYYENQLPEWLTKFNAKSVPDSLRGEKWRLLYSSISYRQSAKDDNPYEGNYKGEVKPVFPHAVNKSGNYGFMRSFPFGNRFTLKAAKACVKGERLGSGEGTDFLCVSLSSPDYIGHQFGPNSVEVEDMYLRLDRDLSDFLAYLDRYVGNGNYLLFLTADHGAAYNAQYLSDLRIPSGNDLEQELEKQLRAYIESEFKADSLILGLENYQIFLNEKLIQSSSVKRGVLKQKITNWFYQKSQTAYVVDLEEGDLATIPEPIKNMAVNGYNRNRSGSLLVINNPGWYQGYSRTGTTHGTWHPYDAHIPLLWYGWNVRCGRSNKLVHMEDIAATLAAMLHIQMPNGCVGKVITEVAR